MRGSLGEKIGEGALSDVHAWAPGQVVKLFKAGVSQPLARHEARMIRAVRSGPAPTMRPRSPSTRGWPACPRRR